jgi:membrane protein implicated in regulation of membrane protease activity
MFQWNWVLVIAGALMILGEVALGGFAGFDFVLIGSAFVIGGGIGLWVGSPPVGLIVASILCIAYVAVGRRFVRRRIHAPNTPTNTDALLGREGIVLQRIGPHAPGQVKINDEIWRASVAADSPRSLEPGERVTVAGVDGVTLQVR